MSDVQICCYDDYRANVLRNELHGTRWEDVVSVDKRLYEYKNKELFSMTMKKQYVSLRIMLTPMNSESHIMKAKYQIL